MRIILFVPCAIGKHFTVCWIDFEKLAIEMHLKNAASANTRFFQLKKKLSDMKSNPTSAMDITDQDDNESADDEKPDPPVKIEDVCEVFHRSVQGFRFSGKAYSKLGLRVLNTAGEKHCILCGERTFFATRHTVRDLSQF